MADKPLKYSREIEFTVLVDGRLDYCAYDLLRMVCYPMTQQRAFSTNKYIVRLAVFIDDSIVDIVEQQQAPVEDLVLDLDLARYALLLRNGEEDSAELADAETLEEMQDPKTVLVKLQVEAWRAGGSCEISREKLMNVYTHAKGLCAGYGWNSVTAAKFHREKLLEAVNAIEPVPDLKGKKK